MAVTGRTLIEAAKIGLAAYGAVIVFYLIVTTLDEGGKGLTWLVGSILIYLLLGKTILWLCASLKARVYGTPDEDPRATEPGDSEFTE